MDSTQDATCWRNRLREFFHADEAPYGLALVRICLPLALLVAAAPRLFHARELFSLDGSPTPLWDNYDIPDMLPIPGGALAVALATLYVVSLITLSLGWMTRLSAISAMVLCAYLGLLDSIGTLTKYTCIATHALLLLSFSECGSLWSVDAWIARRQPSWPGELDASHRRFPAWPRRLLQFLFASVYFGAAITKTQTPGYFSGDQMYFWLLADINHDHPLGRLATLWPSMLVAMGIATLVWEIVFPFLCWRGLPKAGVLAFGVVFHLMTIFMLGLLVFPLVSLSLYWAYIDPQEFRVAGRWLRRRKRTWKGTVAALSRAWNWWPERPDWLTPSMSASGFALASAVSVAVAIEVEQRMDLYGKQRPEGRYSLTALDPGLAEQMVSGLERPRYEDQLHSFDVGTQLLAGRLANNRNTFDYGDQAVVECCIAPPHGDLYIECNLHDAQNRVLQRSAQIMTREKMRTHFKFDWSGSYPAGEYDLVLTLDGYEVGRRRVQVVGRESSTSRTTSTAMAR